jgi:hypothetical protein
MQILLYKVRADTKNEDTGVTVTVTGHGKKNSYLHRLKLTDNTMCSCNEGEQKSKHLIYDCKILHFQRSTLILHIAAGGGNCPTTNSDLVAKYLNAFSRFVKSIDFNKLK